MVSVYQRKEVASLLLAEGTPLPHALLLHWGVSSLL
jgi:hypothetical protein